MEIITGTLVPLETRKSSIVGSSFSSFWEHEFTREFFLILNSCNIHTQLAQISLGVSVAYFSSIAELAMSASRDTPNDTALTSQSMTYFDSVIFLTMFLLIGKLT